MSTIERQRIDEARQAVDLDEFARAANILDVLIDESHSAEGMFLRAQFGVAEESEESFNKRRIKLLNEASALGHAGASYDLSIHLEEGDTLLPKTRRGLCPCSVSRLTSDIRMRFGELG